MRDSIGGLWIKDGRNGKFMSGKITQMNGAELSIVVFKNDKGDNPKRPDYRIYLSEPRGDSPAPTSKPNPKPQTATAEQGDFQDDIPF